ncbi:peptidase S8/S53 domain-containing protein [Kalaharituber pfeilii]|nr:peptidase S8/S53 domain-containing protein [Kalaharituber pfeilii]
MGAIWNFYVHLVAWISLGYLLPVITANISAVEHAYIITLKEGLDKAGLEAHTRWITQVHAAFRLASAQGLAGVQHTFDVEGFKAYAGTFDSATLAAIRENPVASIEPDAIVKAEGCVVQSLTLDDWGLARLSSPGPILIAGPQLYHYDQGPYPCCNGGPTVYVVDTGIQTCHADLEGRATHGFKAVSSWPDVDTCGHGTHVAGTIAGRRYGVMKSAKLVSVKVLGGSGCNGSVAGMLRGLEWIFRHARGPGGSGLACSVVNMSLGITVGKSVSALNSLVNQLGLAGLTIVVAAGNGYPLGTPVDACTVSPAGATHAIAVAATDASDNRTSFSNYGPCVDIFAPGSNILSLWHTSCTATNTLSGTSMAAPQVAGFIAYGKSLYCWSNPAQDRRELLRFAYTGAVGNAGMGSPNKLVNNRGCPPQN